TFSAEDDVARELVVRSRPHTGSSLQRLVQRSPLLVFPSSHSSTPASIAPSPQNASLQFSRHALSQWLPPSPSSHSSIPTATISSPQRAAVQSFRQASPSLLLPSSQFSWNHHAAPSPQYGSRQFGRQPSLSSELPSS